MDIDDYATRICIGEINHFQKKVQQLKGFIILSRIMAISFMASPMKYI